MENIYDEASFDEELDEVVEETKVKKGILSSIPKPVKIVGLALLAVAGAGLGFAIMQHGKGDGYTDLNWKPLDDLAPTADSNDFAEAE